MTQEQEIIHAAVALLREHGAAAQLSQTDEERAIIFVQDLQEGVFDPPPPGASSEQLSAYAAELEEEYQTMGEPLTTLFISTCVLIAFVYGHSKNPKLLPEIIESLGKAGRNILDAKAATDLLNLIAKLLHLSALSEVSAA